MKKGLLILIILLVAVISGVCIYYNTDAIKVNRQLELGDRYLDELEYENAIVAYQAVIAIDPLNSDAYMGMADSYIGLGDFEAAIRVMQEGYDVTGDDEIRNKMETILAMNTEPQDESAEKENEVEEIKEVEFIDISGYEAWGYPRGGVIPIKENGKWGAVNYHQEILVPFEYDWLFYAPNMKGYFVLGNGEEEATYYLFDPNGNLVCESEHPINTSSNFYCLLVDGLDDYFELDLEKKNRAEHYDYEGNLFLTTYNINGSLIDSYSSSDGKTIVSRGMFLGEESETVDNEDGSQTTTIVRNIRLEIGYINEKNEVEWTDKIFYEGGWTSSSETKGLAGMISGYSAGGFIYRPQVPLSTTNKGYYVVYSPYGEIGSPQAMYNVENELIAEWDLWCAKLTEDGFEFDTETYDGYDNWYEGFYYDGEYIYNYGTKMVWCIEGKYFLVDLALAKGKDMWTINDDIIVGEFDYVGLDNENYWLVGKEEKWGYIDHNGNIMKMFDDASAFNDGYAVIIDDGIASVINEEFEVVKEIGEADSAYLVGELFVIEQGEKGLAFQWE